MHVAGKQILYLVIQMLWVARAFLASSVRAMYKLPRYRATQRVGHFAFVRLKPSHCSTLTLPEYSQSLRHCGTCSVASRFCPASFFP